jgi:hypothetical protein
MRCREAECEVQHIGVYISSIIIHSNECYCVHGWLSLGAQVERSLATHSNPFLDESELVLSSLNWIVLARRCPHSMFGMIILCLGVMGTVCTIVADETTHTNRDETIHKVPGGFVSGNIQFYG